MFDKDVLSILDSSDGLNLSTIKDICVPDLEGRAYKTVNKNISTFSQEDIIKLIDIHRTFSNESMSICYVINNKSKNTVSIADVQSGVNYAISTEANVKFIYIRGNNNESRVFNRKLN